MLRIAIVEREQTAKDIIFEIAKIMGEMEWSFVHFTSISGFAKADEKSRFDMVFFNEKFYTERVSASFVENNPKRIVIYCMHTLLPYMQDDYLGGRILYIDVQDIKGEIQRIASHIHSLLQGHTEYLFTYHNVCVPVRMQDIYYIEKCEKLLIYHTAKGEFQERKTMSEAEKYFTTYDFLRIHASYLVNTAHITKLEQEMIALSTQESLPIARARKKHVIDWFHGYVKRK